MIYFEGKRKTKCDSCKGKAFHLVEGWEYICNDCGGLGYKLKTVLVDMETLANKLEKKICRKK